MRPIATACILLAVLALTAPALPAEQVSTLVLPHPLAPGENAWIEVQVGAIARGQEIDVTAASGQELGIISPYGVRVGQDAGTYTLPVPADAIRDGIIVVRLTITQYGVPPRLPTAAEVRSVKLTIAAGTR
jgi:hypothetical protein